MKASTTIGAYALADSVHVSVLPCLTGDTLLDDSRIRRQLNAAMNGSNPTGSPWDRRERVGGRFRRPDGSIVDTLFPVSTGDTPCSIDKASFDNNVASTGVPIVMWHPHPFRPDDSSDPLPYDENQFPPSPCPQLTWAAPPAPGDVYRAPRGPSSVDRKSGYPHIVVEKSDSVYVLKADGSNAGVYPRSGSGVCDPLSL
jgi:hypothetical protein